MNEYSFDSDCLRVPKNEKESYFPTKAFNDSSSFEGQTEFLSDWYSKHLYSMDEPIIHECSENSECYRFTWLRTFHEPIAVRITRTKDKIKLDWKKTNGAGGYDAGDIIEEGSKDIGVKELNIFKSKLENCKFFDLTTNENDNLGSDGAQWVLEGINDENDYHLVDRWCASEKTYGKACLYLLELTGLHVNSELIY
jgi:hypothetical protein